jgi:hypothetical protein
MHIDRHDDDDDDDDDDYMSAKEEEEEKKFTNAYIDEAHEMNQTTRNAQSHVAIVLYVLS